MRVGWGWLGLLLQVSVRGQLCCKSVDKDSEARETSVYLLWS